MKTKMSIRQAQALAKSLGLPKGYRMTTRHDGWVAVVPAGWQLPHISRTVKAAVRKAVAAERRLRTADSQADRITAETLRWLSTTTAGSVTRI